MQKNVEVTRDLLSVSTARGAEAYSSRLHFVVALFSSVSDYFIANLLRS
jgi:hypothetical protein